MAIVKVHNDNVHPHKEEFKGRVILIPAGEAIEMEYEEAVEFKGQYTPMPPAEFNGDESLYYKKIRVDSPPPDAIFKDDSLINHATGKRAGTPAELTEELRALAHLIIKDQDAEKHSKRGDEEVAKLRQELAELRELVSARGPGRPRKEARP